MKKRHKHRRASFQALEFKRREETKGTRYREEQEKKKKKKKKEERT